MEKIMVCPPTRDSIAKEVEKNAESVIDIPPEWPECCIYRVPKHLRNVNETAYTPKLVSIGPFHHIHRADELKDMEKHKQRYLKDFLKERTQKSKEDLRKIIEDKEEKIRHSYSEDSGLGSGDFVNMILLDAVFIIELFLKKFERKEDFILSKPWLEIGIRHDLILLENQLPFFVLEELYRSALGDSSSCNNREEGQQIKKHKEDLKKENSPSFVELSRNYFGFYDKDKEPKSIDEQVTGKPIGEEVKHFTDLLRYSLCPPNMEEYWNEELARRCTGEEECLHSSKKEKYGTHVCATKLDDAGLKFKAKYNERLLDITLPGFLGRFPCFAYSCICACLPCLICLICFPSLTCLIGCFGFPMHIFEVQQLVIDEGTETIFRNLMALEQCLYPSKTYICSYVLLWDHLIDTEKDVDLLVENKVIANHLGSNAEVATLINKLCNQIVLTEPSYFEHIYEELTRHYEFSLNNFLATLKRQYFSNIFKGTATIVGLIIFGFTFWNVLRPFVVEN